MARVASCPQCSHDVLILDDGDQDAWARCPECRAYFQVKDAAAREIHSAQMINDESADEAGETVAADETMLASSGDTAELTVSTASEATVSFPESLGAELDQFELEAVGNEAENAKENVTEDAATSVEWDDKAAELPSEPPIAETPDAAPAGFADITMPSSDAPPNSVADLPINKEPEPAAEAEVAAAQAEITETLDDAAERIDKWFRTAKSLAETPAPASPLFVNSEDEPAADDHRGIELQLDVPTAENRGTTDHAEPTEPVLASVDESNADELELESELAPQDEAQAEATDDVTVEAMDDELRDDAQEPPVREQFAEPPQAFIPPGRLPRRKRSAARTLIMAVTSCVVGLTLGYYALLWIAGPSGDFLSAAQYLPGAMLPAEFQSSSTIVAAQEPPMLRENETVADADATVNDAGGEVQAGYTTPAESGTGDQPLPFEDSQATPVSDAGANAAGRVANAPTFTADELAVSLQAAKEAQPKLVAGNLNDGPAVQRAKGFSYSLLCDLAQKCLFVDATTRADYASALEADVQRLFAGTLAGAHTRDEVARILPKWIGSPHRKHGGVFFAGTLSKESNKGSVVECTFDVEGQESVVVLLSSEMAQQLSSSLRPVGIVGWIVDAPAQQVSGYTGDAPQAIWAGRLVPLE